MNSNYSRMHRLISENYGSSYANTSAILPLQSEDFEQAYQLEQLCYDIPWSEKEFYAAQGSRFHNLKLVINDKIAGYCLCHLVADEASLFNIAIHPAYQHQKFGQKLLHKLINDLSHITTPRLIATLWLEVRVSNEPAKKLYHSMGFNEMTIRKNYYPAKNNQREDAIVMAYSFIT